MNKAVILVVEDDADLQIALCDTLALAGYSTETASDGVEALEVLRHKMVDMVITDIQMPGMDGHELLKQIKTQWQDLPVMLMTAYGSNDKKDEVVELGARHYVEKPFEMKSLRELVFNILG